MLSTSDVAGLRRRFAAQLVPRPWVYWTDMTASAVAGWALLTLAVAPATPILLSVPAIFGSALLLWRATYFIHELSHFRPGVVPGFSIAWHILIGIPALLPSLMIDSHVAHHSRATYGTDGDPEYADVPTWSRAKLVASVLELVIVPSLLVLRWGVLGPLSFLFPPLRRFVVERCSAMVTNTAYRRPMPRRHERRRIWLQEAATTSFVWSVAGLALSGALPLRVLLGYWVMLALALALNQVRTLVSHFYVNEGGGPMSFSKQIDDSATLLGSTWTTGWMTPVGTRYHALHHLLPELPYHGLSQVHAALMEELEPDDPYRGTVRVGVWATTAELWRSAGGAELEPPLGRPVRRAS